MHKCYVEYIVVALTDGHQLIDGGLEIYHNKMKSGKSPALVVPLPSILVSPSGHR